MPDTWDAIIVGAGPAGSSLAARLGALGRPVLLVDSRHFPREKLCGEYFGPGCVPLLDEIGAGEEVQRRAFPIHAAKGISPGGVEFMAHYPPGFTAMSLRRSVLDSILVECARRAKTVEVREGFRVERLIIEDDEVRGVTGRRLGGAEETLRARVTVGADGRNSVVARGLDLFRWHRTHRKFSLGRHYQSVPLSEFGAEIYAGRGLYAILNQQGNGVANLSVIVSQPEFERWKGRLDSGFESFLTHLPLLRRRLEDAQPLEKLHALGPLAHHATRVSAGGALLVGDAAAFYDPFTGEGVYMALVCAKLAAEVIDSGLRQGHISARGLRRYDAARNAALSRRYRFQSLIQRILACPHLANFASRRLARNELMANRLIEFIGGVRNSMWGSGTA